MKLTRDTPVVLEIQAHDPFCMRASIGGLAGHAFYCQLRYGPEGGEPADFVALLERVLQALRAESHRLAAAPGAKYKD